MPEQSSPSSCTLKLTMIPGCSRLSSLSSYSSATATLEIRSLLRLYSRSDLAFTLLQYWYTVGGKGRYLNTKRACQLSRKYYRLPTGRFCGRNLIFGLHASAIVLGRNFATSRILYAFHFSPDCRSLLFLDQETPFAGTLENLEISPTSRQA